jgi:RNA polymerase sigma factor (sigma-70 family)
MVGRFYRDHGHVVLRRARALLGQEQDAQEVLQEVFTSLLDRPDQFERRSDITTWLYAVTTHACLTRLRNSRIRLRILDEQPERVPLPGASVRDVERWTEMRRLLERLPPPLGEVAVQYFLDEMTQQEIAEQLGCSRSQVGNLIAEIEKRTQANEGIAS